MCPLIVNPRSGTHIGSLGKAIPMRLGLSVLTGCFATLALAG